MELGMFIDAADLPSSIMQPNPKQMCHDDILTIPNNGSMCEWYESENAAFIEDTETSVPSLDSARSDSSSRLNILELGLLRDGDYMEEATTHSTSAQFATSNLFLKLDVAHVAATWNRISGNMRSIFSLPREQVVAAAACIPETSSMISAPQVYAKNNGIKDAVHASRDVLETTKMIPHKVLGSQPRPASKKANRKRPKSGKSTDKRPRFKGRFVKREELELLSAT